LKIKLKGRHYDTIEVIEAGSQTVPNTPTEHDFQDTFKKMVEALGNAEGNFFEDDGGQWAQS
jgi:hypothetical protein